MLWAARVCGAAAVVCGVLAAVEYVREQRMNGPEPPWVVSPEASLTPMAASLLLPDQTPVYGGRRATLTPYAAAVSMSACSSART